MISFPLFSFLLLIINRISPGPIHFQKRISPEYFQNYLMDDPCPYTGLDVRSFGKYRASLKLFQYYIYPLNCFPQDNLRLVLGSSLSFDGGRFLF